MHVFALAVRFVLADIFLLSGLAKLPRRAEFTKAIRRYELVSRRTAELVGRWLPPTELAAGAFLLLGIAAPVIAALLGVLLLVFCGAVGANLMRGRRIECGCSGDVAPKRISWILVVRNLVLACSAVICAVAAAPELSLMPLPLHARPALGSGSAFAVCAAVELACAALFLLTNARRAVQAAGSYGRRLEAAL